jgi:hypothetical protein
MATAKPNILINSISGRIGSVVFYKRLGTQCVRTHVIPRNPDTEAQRAVRRSFADAVRSWQAMPPEDQRTYNRRARFLNMSGYNLYISNYMKITIQALYRASTDAQSSKIISPTWNLELATWNHLPLPERIPSVSASGILPLRENPVPYCSDMLCEAPKHSP